MRLPAETVAPGRGHGGPTRVPGETSALGRGRGGDMGAPEATWGTQSGAGGQERHWPQGGNTGFRQLMPEQEGARKERLS